MGILDEAIREHLELKRQHGAADPELKQLEDEAFGPPERPGGDAQAGDALAEAPTEFMAAPETAEENGSEAAEAPAAGEETRQRHESATSIGDLQEAPSEPVEEEQPAAERETVEPTEPPPEEPAASEPLEPPADEDDRQAIAEQPTEHFDVEEELATSAKRGPTDEELIEEEMDEPRLAPVDPLTDMEEVEETQAEAEPAPDPAPAQTEMDEDEDEDDFWSEQRLSEELDQALDAPLDEGSSQAVEAADAEEAEPLEEAESAAEVEPFEEAVDAEEREALREPASDSDVLEDTPDFLEDTPEDDELWFEQKPPKDFDFDD